MKVAFFEYLGRNQIVAKFMKGPSARFANIFTVLSKHARIMG